MKRQLGFSFLAVLILSVVMPAQSWARGGHHGGYHRGHHGGHHGHFRIGFYGGHHGHHRHYGHYYRPYYRYFSPYYYGYGHYRYPYYRGGYGGGYANSAEAPGALDVNVKPKKTTQMWIDGDYVGLARAYDGHPQYLWLPKGRYQLILFSPGHQTVERNITIYPGLVIDLELDMVPGESTPVEDLAKPKPEQEDDSRPADGYGATSAPRSKTAEVEVREVPGKPGRLQLEVTPGDASVYLDGRFLGRGQEIAAIGAGLVIEPGRHVLEVVRPGREPAARTFEAGSGETVELEVNLALDQG